jgi:hypothetical protein
MSRKVTAEYDDNKSLLFGRNKGYHATVVDTDTGESAKGWDPKDKGDAIAQAVNRLNDKQRK